MPLDDLNDEDIEVLVRLLRKAIDGDRYPLSPRAQTLRAILEKLRPAPARPAASPEPRVYAPPRATRRRREGR
jgi:hypothetical protein